MELSATNRFSKRHKPSAAKKPAGKSAPFEECNAMQHDCFRLRHLFGIALAACFFSSIYVPASADAPDSKPAVSFSPAVIDFGVVPSDTKCTQLVTVTLDRRVFPDHLPTLVRDRNSLADVTLFARFDDPEFIRLVYRVTIDAYFQIGPLQDHLILVDNPEAPVPYPPNSLAKNDGIRVVGESVQGLEAPDRIDFGNVKVGATRIKALQIGFYAPPMVHLAPRGIGLHPFPQPPVLISRSTALEGVSVTSTSPYFTAQKFTEIGANASTWQVWTVTFKSHLPLGRDWAELEFKTQDGYCATVLMTAEVVGLVKPEPHQLRKY